MAALPQILSWSAIEQFQKLCQGTKTVLSNPYNTDPEAKDALLSSTQKNVDVAVYNYLKSAADGSVNAGISTGTLQNGGVGLAPFHDWDSRIPADLKAQIQRASDGIKDGSITIGLPQ
jgi:basic membrane protein A and related proteins